MKAYFCDNCEEQYAKGQVLNREIDLICPFCHHSLREIDLSKYSNFWDKFYCKYCEDYYSSGQVLPKNIDFVCPNCFKVVEKLTEENL